MKKSILLLASVVAGATVAHSQLVFQDNFDTSLDSGVETNINFEINDGRQSGGTTSSTYYEQDSTGAGAFLNVNPNFSGGNLLLRTNYNSTVSRASGALLNTNFGSALVGQQYEVRFTGRIDRTPDASTDVWMSFFMFDTAFPSMDLGNPLGNVTNFGALLRQDGRATVRADGTNHQLVAGTTGISNGANFDFLLAVDETLTTPQATLTIGSTVVGTWDLSFVTTDRFFGMRGHQGIAGDGVAAALTDFRYDNLSVTVIPEPGTYAALFGLVALGAVALRRRSRVS